MLQTGIVVVRGATVLQDSENGNTTIGKNWDMADFDAIVVGSGCARAP